MYVNNYLRRIGIDQLEQDKFVALKQLQLQHLLNIPFENLDVIRKIPIKLDVKSFYEKVIKNQRGGYCYELNGLFHWLLKELNYDCYLVAATVLRPDGSYAMERSHATQIVELDQPYVVDVGFGDSTYQPIPLSGEVKEDVSGKYRLQKINDQTFELQREMEIGKWRSLQRIDMTPLTLEDFTEACHFNQTSPNSTFTKHDIVTIATLDGRFTMSDDVFTITKNGEKEKQKIENDEKAKLLQSYFSINLDN